MYHFVNDYSEGAHPRILDALVKTNLEQTTGYSEDCYTKEAIRILKEKIACENCDIHILTGGTQTNLTAIASFLRPYEAAIAVESGHINTHETGAIEASGHKVLTISSKDGKMSVEGLDKVIKAHTDEHMVKPKLVYISDSTEIGTIYKKAELEALSSYCKAHDLLFYMDGARLGSALCAEGNDVKLTDLPKLLDAFYIGGTKNGALIGEALVIVNDDLKKEMRYMIKQRGGLLAKGKLLGIQFVELFKNDLYFELAAHANKTANTLQEGMKALGYSFMVESPTNQIFPILTQNQIEALSEKYGFSIWEPLDEEKSIIRLVTSWATKEEAVEAFLEDLKNL